jgi:hypothetical protein
LKKDIRQQFHPNHAKMKQIPGAGIKMKHPSGVSYFPVKLNFNDSLSPAELSDIRLIFLYFCECPIKVCAKFRMKIVLIPIRECILQTVASFIG